MKGLRKNFERFCYKNHNKGIPNLMTIMVIGSAIVYAISMLSRDATLYSFLIYEPMMIQHGQIWRLFTYIFTYNAGMDAGGLLFTLIGLMCFYFIGKNVENVWGTLKFNLFYLLGIILLDVYGLICHVPGILIDVGYLHMSLFLVFACLYPDMQFLFLFIIPIKAWAFVLLDMGLTIFNIIRNVSQGVPLMWLWGPIVATVGCILFMGKDILNLIPVSWRTKAVHKQKPQKTGSIPFRQSGPDFKQQNSSQKSEKPYTHKCAVCGRTDVSNPELEFRYCSKCNGYYCYCEDHINNHEHIK